jgi:hypothetical protein
MISELVTTRHLSRKAVVYIRQSHPHQVLSNQESLRLQYVRWTPLVRQLGWRVKRESRGIIAPYRCWPPMEARAGG